MINVFNVFNNIIISTLLISSAFLVVIVANLIKKIKDLEEKNLYCIKEITNIYQILVKESEEKHGQTQERATQKSNRTLWGTSSNRKISGRDPGTLNWIKKDSGTC